MVLAATWLDGCLSTFTIVATTVLNFARSINAYPNRSLKLVNGYMDSAVNENKLQRSKKSCVC